MNKTFSSTMSSAVTVQGIGTKVCLIILDIFEHDRLSPTMRRDFRAHMSPIEAQIVNAVMLHSAQLAGITLGRLLMLLDGVVRPDQSLSIHW